MPKRWLVLRERRPLPGHVVRLRIDGGHKRAVRAEYGKDRHGEYWLVGGHKVACLDEDTWRPLDE